MFITNTVYTVTITGTVRNVNRYLQKGEKPSIVVDKKKNMDIISGERISFGRLHRWPAFSSDTRLE